LKKLSTDFFRGFFATSVEKNHHLLKKIIIEQPRDEDSRSEADPARLIFISVHK